MSHRTRSVLAGAVIALAPSAVAQVELQKIVNSDPARRYYRAAPTGDVNGDGVPDVSVSGTGYGAIFSGATGTELHSFVTPAAAPSGLVIGTIDRVGDLDGDGCDDVVFGAPDEGPGGHVKVYSGKTGLLIHDLVGDAPPIAGTNFLGYEVVGLGDVDGDGTPDFGASRYSYIVDEPLAVFVYSGVTGAAIFSNFDTSDASFPNIARAGDVDGDGRADVLLAYTRVPILDSCDSVVELRSGAGGALLRSFEDPEMCGDGTGLVGGADFDGDSVPDVLVGSTYGIWKGPYVTGIVKAYSGATGEPIFTRQGIGVEGDFGASLALLGDIDLDGFVDFAGGEPSLSTPGGIEAGVVHVFSAGSGPAFDVALTGDGKDARFGTSLCVPGDLDDDGRLDLSVTAPGPWSAGVPQGILVTYSLAGVAPGEERFIPGSTLLGEIGSADVDAATFHALSGMKLELKFAVESGDLLPRVRVASKDGKQVVTWSPKKSGTAKKTFVLKRDGEYVLSVEGKHDTTGTYRIVTRWKSLGAVPQSVVKTVQGKNGKPPKVAFAAVAGTIVVGSVESLDGPPSPPSLVWSSPSGGSFPLSAFVHASDSSKTEAWLDIATAESGEHRIAVAPGMDAPTKARFVFELTTPRGHELLVID